MNQMTIPNIVLNVKLKEKTRAKVVPNGNGKPKVFGIPITMVSDAHMPIFSKGKPQPESLAEMRKAKAAIAIEFLERFAREHCQEGADEPLGASLARLEQSMRQYSGHGELDALQPTTLDSALMKIKGIARARSDVKIAVDSMDLSEMQNDYALSDTLVKVAETISHRLEPDRGRITVVLGLSAGGEETQLWVRGAKTLSLPCEIKYAVDLVLETYGATWKQNGSYYLISIPNNMPTA